MSPVLSVKNLETKVEGHRILHQVSFTVEAGEALAVLGANGSGKSTLLRTIVSIQEKSSGTIELFGQENFSDWYKIGWVPQKASLGLELATVREIVSSARIGRRKQCSKAQHRQSVVEALEQTDILELEKRPFSSLSGGQKQRVLIARALASTPELLFLDEPMSGVDKENQLAISAILQDLNRQGITIIAVVHEPGPLMNLLKRAITLDNGHIRHDGEMPNLSWVESFPHSHSHDDIDEKDLDERER